MAQRAQPPLSKLSDLQAHVRRHPLWVQLTTLVLATAIPLLLSSVFMIDWLADQERVRLRDMLYINAKTVASLVDNEIDTHAAIGATLAHSKSLMDGDLPAFRHEVEQALEFLPGGWLALATPDGQMIMNTLTAPGAVLPRQADLDIIRKGFETKRPQIGDIVFGSLARRYTACIEIPVFRDGVPIYSISIAVPPGRIQGLIDKKFTNGEIVGVVDRQKRFIARIPDGAASLGRLASEGWRKAMEQTPEGWAESLTLEGNPSVTGYAQTARGWTVGIAHLTSEIDKPLRSILWFSILGSAGLTALGLACAFGYARGIVRDVGALSNAAKDLAHGRTVAVVPAPFREAEAISSTLSFASAELNRREELLKSANEDLEEKVAVRTRQLEIAMKQRLESEATLRQVQKMEAIGQLTGGIAHDFNNMLTIIIGNIDSAQRRANANKPIEELLRPIAHAMQGARNAEKLTHRLLAFSRQQPLAPVAIDMNALILGLADLLSRTVGENIKVETVTSAGLWQALADENQLENCLVNLAVNARDAMPEGGQLTIETANAILDDGYAAAFGDLKSGQYVMLSVSDTGTGIPPNVIERIFEPFFTTKDAGKGTGLGLAMIHGFVKQSNGHIRIYSEIGEGTTVKIYLPRLAGDRPTAVPKAGLPADSQSVPRAAAGETILVVEDDPGVRTFAESALIDLGYRVETAQSGDEALQILRSGRPVSLLFTDIVLGGRLNGRQLADEAKKLQPELPVLFTTGYTRNATVQGGRLDSGVHFLCKPYTLRELAIKIESVRRGQPSL